MRPPERPVVQCGVHLNNRTGTGLAFKSAAQRIIVIVGGGFCGTGLTIRLLREHDKRLRIDIVEPRAEHRAGVAHATRDHPYPLNVATGQMSLDCANPGDFLEFACGQGIRSTRSLRSPGSVASC